MSMHLLGRLAGRAIDTGELFFQSVRSEAWVMEDGIIKEGAFSADRGVGVRAISGERTGFAYSDDIVLPGAGGSGGCGAQHRSQLAGPASIECERHRAPSAATIGRPDRHRSTRTAKISLLRELDAQARANRSRASRK